MATCPNFESLKYKYLESKIGILEAFKYWHQNNGDLSKVLTDEERKSLIDRAKYLASISTNLGIYKSPFLDDPEGVLKEFGAQLNSSKIESEEAARILEPELTAIALQLRDSENLTPKSVNATMKVIGALKDDKYRTLFDRFFKTNPSKFYEELSKVVPKNQIELLKDLVNNENYTSVDEMIAGLLANVSYTVEVNEATEEQRFPGQEDIRFNGDVLGFKYNEATYMVDRYDPNNLEYTKLVPGGPPSGIPITKEEYDRAFEAAGKNPSVVPTSYYQELAVPGGTNYRENEIRTPDITPSRKGHAQFSTDQGIGWFRSDDKTTNKLSNIPKGSAFLDNIKKEFESRIKALEQKYNDIINYKETSDYEDLLDWRDDQMEIFKSTQLVMPEQRTRRILEVQSDLFQKERNNNSLTKAIDPPARYDERGLIADGGDEDLPYFKEDYAPNVGLSKKDKDESDYIDRLYEDNRQNNFLQLLNKDNTWVTFFIKSIIQDSTRKGYENVLFPSGNTAAKVEGHETVEQFLANTQRHIDNLKERLRPEDLEKGYNESVNHSKELIEKMKSKVKELKSGESSKLSSSTDHHISPKVVDSKFEFVRIRQNHYNKNVSDTLTGDDYKGWILYEYTVEKGQKITKLTDSEAKKLLDKDLERRIKNEQAYIDDETKNLNESIKNKKDVINKVRERYEADLKHTQEEYENARLGRTKLSSIGNFYENTVYNILKKQGYSPEKTTDEYGNSWFKVDLNPSQLSPFYFNKINPGSLIGALQSEGKLGKRVGPKQYEIPIDPSNFNLVDQQQKAFEIAQSINAQTDKEAVQSSVVNGNAVVTFNEGIYKFVRALDSNDIESYKNFLMDNLYTRKDNPTTTELIKNAANLAKDLGRQDLVDVARLIHKNIYKNPGLSARVVNSVFDEIGVSNSKAYYNRATNKVTFGRETIGTGTLEAETDTVLHEFLHGLTFQPWIKASLNRELDQNEKDFMYVVDTYYNYFKSRKGAETTTHEFSSPDEFLMASLMDRVFQEHLKDISQGPSVLQFFKDLFKSILRLLGVKINDNIVDRIDPNSVQKDMFKALSTYLNNLTKSDLVNSIREEGRDYGLSFKVVSDQDYEETSRKMKVEREQMRATLKDDLKTQLKESINKSILAIKSFGSNIRKKIPESQEGFKAIFRQLKKLEDPAYNLDQIDYFFDFTGEISAIMNVANDKISKLQNDSTIEDPDFKLKEYEDIMSAIRNFDPVLQEIQGIKIQLENLGYRTSLKELDDITLKRNRIESIYSLGVFPIVTSKFVDILSEGSKKAVEQASERIDELNKRISLANKNNNKSRAIQLEKEKATEQARIDKEFRLNSDTVSNWLRGQMGDSNILTVWSMAGVSNNNPIVSGLSKFIRDNVGEIAPKVLNLMNSIQDSLESYSKSTNRSLNDISSFNSPMIQVHRVITGKDKDGNYTYDNKQSLLHEFNGKHIEELQKFKRELTDLYSEKREIENKEPLDEDAIVRVSNKIKDIQTKQKQFLRDYMEQKYAPEVHAALDMLHEDLGGYTIWDYMGPIIARIEDTELAIEQEPDQGRLTDLYKQLDDYNLEMSRLGALYEKSSDTRELKVAEKLRERRELLKKYSDFVLTDKGKIQFETQMARMKRKLSNGEITPEKYERFIEDNTVTEYTPAYWDKKHDILSRLNSVLTKMGAKTEKDETVGKLYKDMEEITQPHRDANGIINGREMTQKELRDVKNVEQQIEDAKDRVENFFGLTKLERIEASNLRTQIGEINSAIFFEPDENKKAQLEDYKFQIEARAREISAKKKNVDKKLSAEYYQIVKELAELDQSKVTKYYYDEYDERLAQEKAKINIDEMPSKFITGGRVYQKNGDSWNDIGFGTIVPRDNTYVEQIYRELAGGIKFKVSDWYKDNHITKMRYEPNVSFSGDYTGGDSPGDWREVEEPTYAWKQTRPRDEFYINTEQPSIKYKQRQIKEGYVNKSYKEGINGDLRPKLHGAPDNRFINQDYFKLINSSNSDDIATARFLKYLTDTYFKSQESIPMGMRPGYELPSIRKSDTEKLSGATLKQTSQDFFNYLGQVGQLFKEKVISNEQDKDILFGYNDDINGIVPVKFIGDIDSKNQSIDLPRSILTFASEMLKREQLIRSQPFANAVKEIVNNPQYKPVKTKDGIIQSIKKKFLPKNTEVAVKSQTNNTALQINEIIKGEIYGEQMKDQPGAKFVNTALGLGAKSMLGLNFISSVQNYANAFTQSIMETESKNRNFSMKSYFKAQKIYYGRMDELMSDLGKYGNKSYINQFFDYFGGINYKIFSKNHKTLAFGKVGEFSQALSVPNQITEHMLNYHMGIAIALDYRVSDGKGNMVPIFDAFTLKDKKIIQKEGFDITEKDRKEMISRLNSSSRRVNGEYGDKILLDKYVLGRLVTFMNRYLIPFVVKRYGSRRFDIQDGVRNEGYWRLLGKLFIKDIKAKSLPIIGGWKYYTRQEKEAIIKASTEFGFTIMFALAISAMGGDDKDKVKRNSTLENNLLYALKGIQQQNEAFMPVPGVGFDDLLRKVQNPFPILGKLKNLVSLINDGTHTAWYEMGLPGVDEHDVKYMQKTGWHKPGDLKMFSDLQKLIGVKKIENYLYPDEALKAQESLSRIK